MRKQKLATKAKRKAKVVAKATQKKGEKSVSFFRRLLKKIVG